MKRFLFAGGVWLAFIAAALAANRTPTPIVPPNETGEWDAMQQQVVDVARFKPGVCSVTISISSSTGSGTCTAASGVITLTTATAGASGTTPSVVTLTNNKVQAGDIVLCTVDQTGATAGSVEVCNAHVASANTVTLTLYDPSVTAMTSSTVILNFLVLTQGNPN